ncbi:MAG TPA: PSD1 and planctomycete cytochrome C domain-containing protein [Chthonomonadales bacterium]|nr:PSD1 and planctomycete cytochrome C domain-containing protein [Chthonomonadales bacterium]
MKRILPGSGACRLILGFAAAAAPLLCLAGAPPKQAAVGSKQTDFFETAVRPLLISRCISCHGGKLQSSGLRLDSIEAILKGGARGPAIVLADPAHSRLIQAVQYNGALKMPPDGKLKPAEIEALTVWVKMGAPWPAVTSAQPAAAAGKYVITAAQRSFWSFRPVKLPAPPAVKNIGWCRNPVDRFILSKLESKGLQPAPEADRRTLIRRLSYDLIGLPPTIEQVDAFVQDRSPHAYRRLVDRLLASPRYGERWGRYWLDVARYADTKGYAFTEDPVYHNAYTYRDYVIRAFNEDLPYNQFILQQLAADQLPLNGDPRSLAALGFLRVGRGFLNDPTLINDDRIDATCRGFLGLTVGCARCHDHKFDPIPSKDYYSLYGVFASSTPVDLPISREAISAPYMAYKKKQDALNQARSTLILTQVARLRRMEEIGAQVTSQVKTTLQAFGAGALPSGDQLKTLEPSFEAGAPHRVDALQQSIDALQKTAPPVPEFAMAMQDSPQPYNPRVFIRGNPNRPGDPVPRRYLAILSGPDRKPFQHGSGRLELAEDIASASNPLTARVLVNRVWMHHFGEGIVRTPSDFGARGDPPTHPELLDWLAGQFTAPVDGQPSQREQSADFPDGFACGWSIKRLQRLIVLSSVYRESDSSSQRDNAVDPQNLLLSHRTVQRLDLEALRDSLLDVSGQLDLTVGGPSVDIVSAPFSRRRTVYGFIDRQNLPGLFRTFDFASPDTSNAMRHETSVPQQALFMMNSPFVVQLATALAGRREVTALPAGPRQINMLYRLALQRSPTHAEVAMGLQYLREAGQAENSAVLTSTGSAHAPGLTPLAEYAQALLMTNEFAFVD